LLREHDPILVEIEFKHSAYDDSCVRDQINLPRRLDLLANPVAESNITLSQHPARHLDRIGMSAPTDVHEDEVPQISITETLLLLARLTRRHRDHLLIESQEDRLREDVVVRDRTYGATIDAHSLPLLAFTASRLLHAG
jgi:hypothetical protein